MPVDATTLWLIAGAILLVATVFVGFVAVGRRRALRTGEQPAWKAHRVAGKAEDAGDAPSATQVDVRPRHKSRSLTSNWLLRRRGSSARGSREPAATPASPAGSNSQLSRGLLLLITRDRIDEDTWDEFEETLITSDLGVAPATELWMRCAASCGSRTSGPGQGHPAGRTDQAGRSHDGPQPQLQIGPSSLPSSWWWE